MDKEDKNKIDTDSDDDVFVKLKPKEKPKFNKEKKKIIAAISANKYKYIGKVNKFISKKMKKDNEKKNVGFSDWKGLFG